LREKKVNRRRRNTAKRTLKKFSVENKGCSRLAKRNTAATTTMAMRRRKDGSNFIVVDELVSSSTHQEYNSDNPFATARSCIPRENNHNQHSGSQNAAGDQRWFGES